MSGNCSQELTHLGRIELSKEGKERGWKNDSSVVDGDK